MVSRLATEALLVLVPELREAVLPFKEVLVAVDMNQAV